MTPPTLPTPTPEELARLAGPAGMLGPVPPTGGPVVPLPSSFTPEQIEALVGKPLSVSGDTGSRTARSGADVRELLELAEELRNRQRVNAAGGRRSAWRQNGLGKVIPPGTV